MILFLKSVDTIEMKCFAYCIPTITSLYAVPIFPSVVFSHWP